MGISFIVDDLIENGAYDGLNTGWNPINPKVAREALFRKKERQRAALYEATVQYKKATKEHDVEVIKRTQKQIETELIELESALYYFRVCEKNLLRLMNKYQMNSVVISDITNGLLEYFNDSCSSIVELRDEIKNNTGYDFTCGPKEVDEENVKKEIVKMIFDVVDNGISMGLPLSREMFRCIIKDLEKVLEVLEYNGKAVKKAKVEEYFIINYKKKTGMIICQNCKKTMLADIPYCFNCYDGRYS